MKLLDFVGWLLVAAAAAGALAFSLLGRGDRERDDFTSDVTLSQFTAWAGTESEPSFSPDGNDIAFVSRGAVTWEIFAVELGSGRVRQLTRTIDARTSSQGPAWSPDGSQIAFDRARDGNFDIYVMNADGSGIVQLTHGQAVDARPAWSPDARSIVFHSTRDRPRSASADDRRFLDLYIMAADGSNVSRLTSNRNFDAHPRWGR